jgi:hypothetical protein
LQEKGVGPPTLSDSYQRSALFGVVPIDSDVPSPEFDTDKTLIDTEALSEIDDSIGAVRSDSRHENRPRFFLT